MHSFEKEQELSLPFMHLRDLVSVCLSLTLSLSHSSNPHLHFPNKQHYSSLSFELLLYAFKAPTSPANSTLPGHAVQIGVQIVFMVPGLSQKLPFIMPFLENSSLDLRSPGASLGGPIWLMHAP